MSAAAITGAPQTAAPNNSKLAINKSTSVSDPRLRFPILALLNLGAWSGIDRTGAGFST